MKTLLILGGVLIFAGFAQLESPYRHINDIERHAQHWFDTKHKVRYTKIVHHETYETEKGGKVCYRGIHPAFVDVVCLGWDKSTIKHISTYRIKG